MVFKGCDLLLLEVGKELKYLELYFR